MGGEHRLAEPFHLLCDSGHATNGVNMFCSSHVSERQNERNELFANVRIFLYVRMLRAGYTAKNGKYMPLE